MIDYTPYITAVYLIALVAYGGGTLLWSRQLKRALTDHRHALDNARESQAETAGGEAGT